MKSIKPGRGPSGMSFVGSIIAIIFGIIWTVMASSLSSNSGFGFIGSIFPVFGVVFIIVGILNAVYNYKNATGKNRYSLFDITDSSEEGDPSDKWIKQKLKEKPDTDNIEEITGFKYCPYCGLPLDKDYYFCPKCGKGIK